MSDKKVNEEAIKKQEDNSESNTIAEQPDKVEPIIDFEKELKQAQEEIQSLKDGILREKAENDNIRKRFAKELEETNKYAITNFAKDLLEVLENLHRATESISEDMLESKAIKSIYDGVELTKSSLIGVFNQYGIARIFPLDQQFDHNLHQAIIQVPTNDKEPGTITQVIQAGYVMKGRLLRPALVGVATSSEGNQG